MIDEQSLIIQINRLRPSKLKPNDDYSHGKDDTIDEIIAVINRMVSNQQTREGR